MRCGPSAGGQTCPGSLCCSRYGWCGSSNALLPSKRSTQTYLANFANVFYRQHVNHCLDHVLVIPTSPQMDAAEPRLGVERVPARPLGIAALSMVIADTVIPT